MIQSMNFGRVMVKLMKIIGFKTFLIDRCDGHYIRILRSNNAGPSYTTVEVRLDGC